MPQPQLARLDRRHDRHVQSSLPPPNLPSLAPAHLAQQPVPQILHAQHLRMLSDHLSLPSLRRIVPPSTTSSAAKEPSRSTTATGVLRPTGHGVRAVVL